VLNRPYFPAPTGIVPTIGNFLMQPPHIISLFRSRDLRSALICLFLVFSGSRLCPAVLNAQPTSEAKPVILKEVGNLKLMPIAAGSFTMGSTHGLSDENPVTRVTLSQSYWLGATEVTQGQWEAVMGNNPSDFKGTNLPVERVSDGEALAFCRKVTEQERAAGRLPEGYEYTLPTEAQWEYACRAGTTGEYAGNLDAMGWYESNSGKTTHEVGGKRANAWGLYDMHGNVWEWCLDWYGDYAGGNVIDPRGASDTIRVNRGGCWKNQADNCRATNRNINARDSHHNWLGFRLALSSVR
jgi:formylglycine-generating enzyme required for sulfatase activity